MNFILEFLVSITERVKNTIKMKIKPTNMHKLKKKKQTKLNKNKDIVYVWVWFSIIEAKSTNLIELLLQTEPNYTLNNSQSRSN